MSPLLIVCELEIDFLAFLVGLRKACCDFKLDMEGAEVPILESLLYGGLIDRADRVLAETHERIIPELAERTIALRRRVAHDGACDASHQASAGPDRTPPQRNHPCLSTPTRS